MNAFSIDADRLFELAGAICNGSASEIDVVELDAILRADGTSRRRYLDYCQMHAALRLQMRARQAATKVRQQMFARGDSALASPDQSEPNKIKTQPTAPVGFLSTTILHGAADYFSSGWPMAYLVATVIFGIGLVIGAVTYVSHPIQVVKQSAPDAKGQPMAAPEMQFVGRITGMVDCEFADQSTITFAGANVPLDRKYALSSGLMEITYNTGAKVILHGPVDYEVESKNGGFMPLGRLTGRMNTKAAQGFTIRTPNAVVTDWGTEFGVEVDGKCVTYAQVFAGKVQVAPTGKQNDGDHSARTLTAGQYAEVGKDQTVSPSSDNAEFRKNAKRFTRTMPRNPGDGDAYARMVLSMNPVIYYRMDEWPVTEKANAYVLVDSAPGGHHGVAYVAQAFGKPSCSGKFGGAIERHGAMASEYAFVGDYPKAENNQLSVSAWIWPFALTQPATIVGNWCFSPGVQGDGRWMGQFAFGINKTLRLAVEIRQPGKRPVEASERGRSLTSDQWHHVAFVADGSALHLYHNGVEVDSRPYREIPFEATLKGLGIGCNANKDGSERPVESVGPWHGRIDEIAIFNRALSAEQVRRLHCLKENIEPGNGK